MKIVLRDPPLPFLVMAIVLKVPMSKGDAPVEAAPTPPEPEEKASRKPNQWERGTASRTWKRGNLA